MAICDANYIFTIIDTGSYGSQSDSNIFHHSALQRQLLSGPLQLPVPKSLFENGPKLPCYLLGDGGFGMQTYLMRPYPGRTLPMRNRVFNYRHSRGRRVIENAFGILSNKWGILHRPINMAPEYAIDVVKACCILHNFVRKSQGKFSLHDSFGNLSAVDVGDWEVGPLGDSFNSFQSAVGNSSKEAKRMRECLADFYNGVGNVPWQNDRV